jgi:hypothetical protein
MTKREYDKKLLFLVAMTLALLLALGIPSFVLVL